MPSIPGEAQPQEPIDAPEEQHAIEPVEPTPALEPEQPPSQEPAVDPLAPEGRVETAYWTTGRAVRRGAFAALATYCLLRTVVVLATPDYTNMPTAPQHFEVVPVTVQAEGFAPAEYPKGVLEGRVLLGWQKLSQATHGVVSSEVSVTVEPTRTLTLPGVTKAPDFCDPKAVDTFRSKLVGAVTSSPDKRGKSQRDTTIIVVEQKNYAGCVLADAGPGMGMVVYSGNNADELTYLHEDGHLAGFGHDGRMKCPDPAVIDASCEAIEYGNWDSAQGNTLHSADVDPLTGYNLYRVGAMRSDEVLTVLPGTSQAVRLGAVNNTLDGSTPGPKLVRIPMIGTGDPKATPLACANNVYIELSGEGHPLPGTDFQLPLALRVYTVNDREPMPNTYLIPFDEVLLGDKHYAVYALDWHHKGQEMTATVGNTTISIRIQDYPRLNNLGKGTIGFALNVQAAPVASAPSCWDITSYRQ